MKLLRSKPDEAFETQDLAKLDTSELQPRFTHLSLVKSLLVVIVNLGFQGNLVFTIYKVALCSPESSGSFAIHFRSWEQSSNTLKAALLMVAVSTSSIVAQMLNSLYAAILAFSGNGCFKSSSQKLTYYNVQITLGIVDFLARGVVVFMLVLQISVQDQCVQEDKRSVYKHAFSG